MVRRWPTAWPMLTKHVHDDTLRHYDAPDCCGHELWRRWKTCLTLQDAIGPIGSFVSSSILKNIAVIAITLQLSFSPLEKATKKLCIFLSSVELRIIHTSLMWVQLSCFLELLACVVQSQFGKKKHPKAQGSLTKYSDIAANRLICGWVSALASDMLTSDHKVYPCLCWPAHFFAWTVKAWTVPEPAFWNTIL